MEPTPAAEFKLYVHDEIFSYGQSWEEPEEVEGHAFYVIAEGKNGERYAHFKDFRLVHSCVQKGCYENGGDADWRCPDAEKNEFPSEAAAQVAAASLLFRIVQAQKAGTWRGPVENEHWNYIRPAYGSLAYEEGDWSAIDAEEEARAEGFTLVSGRPEPR